jgi:hypothetical protein
MKAGFFYTSVLDSVILMVGQNHRQLFPSLIQAPVCTLSGSGGKNDEFSFVIMPPSQTDSLHFNSE